MDYAAVDDEGFVLATANCPDPPPPYSVCESSKYPGRYYFYNSETRLSQWRLAQWSVEANEKGVVKAASPAEVKTINKDVRQSFGVPGSLQERLKERHLAEDMKDTWALDRVEFCALLKALDDEDSALHIDKNHNDEFLISKHLSAAYSRQLPKKSSTFKTRLKKKLAGT